jgi:hypothetical protein
MSAVQEIEAALPRLSWAELEDFRAWFEDYLEGQQELTYDVKAKLNQSPRELAAGQYTTRQSGRAVVAAHRPARWGSRFGNCQFTSLHPAGVCLEWA